jgi:hypothetical protein
VRLLPGFVGALVLVLGLSTPAHAQIYAWRDVNGRLVLSNVHMAEDVLAPSGVPNIGQSGTERAPARLDHWYDDLIAKHAQLKGVRRNLVRAVVQVESAFNPYARSPKGALGLMQLMPATMQRFGVIDPYNPADNVRAGVAYLRELLDRYDDNETLALAAYNAGPGAVDDHGQKVPPYAETRHYVSRVSEIARQPDRDQTSEAAGATRIYKTIEIVGDREVIRYSDRKPK